MGFVTMTRKYSSDDKEHLKIQIEHEPTRGAVRTTVDVAAHLAEIEGGRVRISFDLQEDVHSEVFQ